MSYSTQWGINMYQEQLDSMFYHVTVTCHDDMSLYIMLNHTFIYCFPSHIDNIELLN